ncbi:MAG: glycosyltransferase family 4 protein [Lachnospiraceae bacterium]|nr:glycosyltransferase family 4 protein [Lachnospiraceae bacterium]
MKVFMVGDFINDDGPGVANKQLKIGLSDKDVIYCEASGKIARVVELFKMIWKSDVVCFCSPSNINTIGLLIAKMMKKKSFYRAHGFLYIESALSNNITEKIRGKILKKEKFWFKMAEKTYWVSKHAKNEVLKYLPEYEEKFDYVYNGIDFSNIENIINRSNCKRQNNYIISVGGGMKRKNNLMICRAINSLNQKGYNLRFIVIGKPYTEKDKICKYDFVEYYEKIPHDKVIEKMKSGYLYIQNSDFETFGMAVVEAIFSGCNILISDAVGAIDVLDTIEDSDLIRNTQDLEEIEEKIKNILSNPNNQRIKEGLNIEKIDNRNIGHMLYEKMLEEYRR